MSACETFLFENVDVSYQQLEKNMTTAYNPLNTYSIDVRHYLQTESTPVV